MKTSTKALKAILCLFLFASMLTTTYSQANNSKKTTRNVDSNYPSIAIKVYTCPNGTQSLMVYNPDDPNFYFYGSQPYLIRWYQDGGFLGESPFLETVCGRKFTVEIINYAEGWSTHKDYYMGCRPTSTD